MSIQFGGLYLCLIFALIIPDAVAGENPSNPLSKVKNTDIQARYFDLEGGSERTDRFIQGSFMATEKFKIRYEAHSWDTDVTGKNEQEWESLHLRSMYFPTEGTWGDTRYRTAVGLEWVKSFDHGDKGIGVDSDLLSPFLGIALVVHDNLVLVPMLQHFTEYSGNDLDITAARMVAVWKFAAVNWIKVDARVSHDWDNDQVPAAIEMQFGRMFTSGFGIYLEGFSGAGGDRSFDWGAGLGLRFVY